MTLPIIFGNENAKNQVEPTKFCQNKQQSSYIFATMEITVTVQNMQNYATLQKRCVFLRSWRGLRMFLKNAVWNTMDKLQLNFNASNVQIKMFLHFQG